MPKPPSRRNKATSAASTDSTSAANSANGDISQQVDPDSISNRIGRATIDDNSNITAYKRHC